VHQKYRAYAPQPGCGFNADANTGHAFGIVMVTLSLNTPHAKATRAAALATEPLPPELNAVTSTKAVP